MKTDLESLNSAFATHRDRYIAEWSEFLRFPSISAEPAHADDCRRCSDWLTQHLAGLGFRAERLDTPGRPAVFAVRDGQPGRPVVLFYGHYDVQPVDPLADWTTPPFEPALRDGRLYARGAQDNKGQVFYAVKALEHLIRSDWAGATVKVLIEGEEENGSGGLGAMIPLWKERLKADILMVCDTGAVDSGAPTITMGLRGIVFVDFVLDGPDHDLHSGTHGGAAPNPAMGMAHLLAGLHRADGSIAVEGFYDGVQPPSDRERALSNRAPIDVAAYRRDTGVDPVSGEPAFTPRERIGFRPTLEVNGLHSGYGGPGTKTIIPAMAEAKLSARLVPGQDPRRTLDAILRHLEGHVPRGLRLRIRETQIAGPGFRLDAESPLVAKADAVLRRVAGRDTAFLWEGASVPIVSALAAASGAEPLLVGFGQESDRIHAPNESFSIEQFRKGFLYVSAFLADL
jgi:acetylornithine deacetylase/succinyl-diaminopimelate desuccinylase-like protein